MRWLARKGLAIAILLAVVPLTTYPQSSVPSDEDRISKLTSIVGREVFACYEAPFYHFEFIQPTSDKPLRIAFREKAIAFPLLTGLKISKVILSGQTADVMTFAVVVAFQKDISLVMIVHLPRKGKVLEGDNLFSELLREHAGKIFDEIPKGFSEQAMDSIRTYSAAKDMTSTELTCALGWPEQRNDYGNSGQQWVYRHGKLMVYLDAESGKVKDVQTFE